MSEKLRSYIEQTDSVVEKWQSEISPRDIAERLENLFSKFRAKLDALPSLKPEQKVKLEGELRSFLFDSVTNALQVQERIWSGNQTNVLSKFNRETHDTDREKWLDSFEAERYVRTLNDALSMITELGWIEKFRSEMIRIHKEIESSSTIRMSLMGTRHEKTPYSQAFTEKYTATLAGISPEEARRLQGVPFSKNPSEFFQWLSISLGTKLPPEMLELVGKFIYDMGKAIMQLPEYFYFAYKFERSNTTTEKFEYSEKMKSRLDDNLALGILALMYDGTADITWNMLGWEWKISADAQGRRVQEMIHAIGRPSTWTPEWVKDGILALVPLLPKLAREIKARKTEKTPESIPKWETPPRIIEDIPRETPKLRTIERSEHISYSTEKISQAQEKLGEIIGRIRYNSLDRTVTLLRAHETNPTTPLLSKYKDFKVIQSPEMVKNGGNCVVMSLELQAELRNMGVDSKVVRFEAGNLLNNKAELYIGDSHSALVIPRLEMWKSVYTLLDPGLWINKAIPFSLNKPSSKVDIGWGKTAQVVPNLEPGAYPSLLLLESKSGKVKKLPFDPTRELTNPHETISKDVMRGLSDFKIVKQSPEWSPLAVLKVDIKDRNVTIQNGSNPRGTEKIPFEKFESEILKPDTARNLSATAKILGETRTTLTEKIRIMIRNTEAYKNEVWNPSARAREASPISTPWAR